MPLTRYLNDPRLSASEQATLVDLDAALRNLRLDFAPPSSASAPSSSSGIIVESITDDLWSLLGTLAEILKRHSIPWRKIKELLPNRIVDIRAEVSDEDSLMLVWLASCLNDGSLASVFTQFLIPAGALPYDRLVHVALVEVLEEACSHFWFRIDLAELVALCADLTRRISISRQSFSSAALPAQPRHPVGDNVLSVPERDDEEIVFERPSADLFDRMRRSFVARAGFDPFASDEDRGEQRARRVSLLNVQGEPRQPGVFHRRSVTLRK